MVVSSLPQENNYQCSPAKKFAGFTLGATVGILPNYLTAKGYFSKIKESELKFNAMAKFMPEVDSFEKTKANALQIIKKEGLDKLGVKLFVATPQTKEKLNNELLSIIPKHFPCKENYANNISTILSHGMNACYVPKNKYVIVNDKTLYSSIYHEIGHSLNHNKTFLFKNLQKLRGIITPLNVPILGIAFLAVGLMHKNTNKKNETLGDKTKDFIKNNAGKLTFATFMPMLIEEFTASKKGLKLAKNLLKPDQFKNLSKNYKVAFSSYLITAAFLSSLITFGIFINDKITKKKK